MNTSYKPNGYNSLSPYLIVDNAQKLVDLLKAIFNATEKRRFDDADGRIIHIELQLDDSILMLADSTENFPPHKLMMHLYVPDVLNKYKLAIENGCTEIEKPVRKPGDPDTRGSFMDFAGNFWAIGTQSAT